MHSFLDKGWAFFDHDDDVSNWIEHARDPSYQRAQDPVHLEKWSRHQGTWFVGADVLGNDRAGRLPNGPKLAGAPIEFCKTLMDKADFDWGPGQVSICYDGYPKQDPYESDAAHAFRINRDAAHLDGLKPVGTPLRRFFEEYHGFILGLPVNDAPLGASPFVIWEGSHIIIQKFLADHFAGLDPADWPKQDLTDSYKAIRTHIFDTCARKIIHAKPGQAYVAHRFAIHGVAPWAHIGAPDHRSVIYFRPFWGGDKTAWLAL